MFDQFKIDINGSIVLFFLLAIVFIVYTVWMYRTTIPPSGRLKRNILTIARSVALATILFFLFEPVLVRFYQERELPVIPVLIDCSKSMSIQDSLGSRSAQVIRFLKDPAWKELSEKNDIQYFLFADSLKAKDVATDSIAFDGWITDIAASLETAKNRMNGNNLTAMMLISDGQYNYGSNPVSFAEFVDIPVHTVGVGDVYEKKDISIEQVLSNSVAFVNSKIPIDVMISSNGYQGKPLTIQIRKNQKIIDSKVITAPEDLTITTARFDVIADEEGMQKYEISVIPLSGELTASNNSKAVYIQVLKNRVKILFISGQPGPDQTMIYQTIISNPDYKVRSLVQKPSGDFITVSDDQTLPDAIGEYDCYILNQYPTTQSSAAYFGRLADHIRTNQKPWMFLYGPGVDLNKYQQMKNAGGIDFASDPNIKETLVSLKLTNQGKSHSIMQINESLESTDRFWSDLPPVWIQKVITVPSPNSSVLARVDMSKAPQTLKLHGDIPLIISHKEKKQKSLSVAFYGFWKMYFTPLGLGKNNPAYSRFFEQSVRWLTLTDDTKPVLVMTNKTVYQSGEKIVISGQAYDDQFKPVSDAAFRVNIRSKDVHVALQMNSAGNGRYESVNGALPVGDYTISGEAEWNAVMLGRDEKKFSVEAYSVELIHTAQNRNLLQRIAQLSGGRYLTADQPEELRNLLNYEILILDKKQETDLWNKPVMLFFIAALLALEWWIRKRSDML